MKPENEVEPNVIKSVLKERGIYAEIKSLEPAKTITNWVTPNILIGCGKLPVSGEPPHVASRLYFNAAP
jgi:hypothetical protein